LVRVEVRGVRDEVEDGRDHLQVMELHNRAMEHLLNRPMELLSQDTMHPLNPQVNLGHPHCFPEEISITMGRPKPQLWEVVATWIVTARPRHQLWEAVVIWTVMDHPKPQLSEVETWTATGLLRPQHLEVETQTVMDLHKHQQLEVEAILAPMVHPRLQIRTTMDHLKVPHSKITETKGLTMLPGYRQGPKVYHLTEMEGEHLEDHLLQEVSHPQGWLIVCSKCFLPQISQLKVPIYQEILTAPLIYNNPIKIRTVLPNQTLSGHQWEEDRTHTGHPRQEFYLLEASRLVVLTKDLQL